MSAWRPIADYPAGEAVEDVLVSDGERVWLAWCDDDGRWWDSTMGDRNADELEPTDWQPLPDPSRKPPR